MQTQPQVSFDDLPVDEAVRDAALDHINQLERVYDRITGCRIVIAQPHRHHRERLRRAARLISRRPPPPRGPRPSPANEREATRRRGPARIIRSHR